MWPALPASAGVTGVTTPPPSARAGTTFSFRPWLSAGGRLVAFDSDSAALVARDTNRARDIFVHDREQRTMQRISLGPGGAEADDDSQRPTLSADGRYVAFWSEATNLVEDDTNGVADAFVHDRAEGTIRRVSVGPSGAEADGASARPVISADGRFVAFESAARNLLPPALLGRRTDTNGVRDVFVHELATAETTRVSVTSEGTQGEGESLRPTISGDGSLVAFQSSARLAPDDGNTARDVYVHNRTTGRTTLISAGPDGEAGTAGSFSPSISAGGDVVAFWSNASNLVAGDANGRSDIFVHELATGATSRVSVTSAGAEADGDSSDPSVSPDGRYVSFWSEATDLVGGDTNGMRDVFLHDRVASSTVRVSTASDGRQANGDSFSPNVTGGAEGVAVVAFDSKATNLVDGDRNRGSDVFVAHHRRGRSRW